MLVVLNGWLRLMVIDFPGDKRATDDPSLKDDVKFVVKPGGAVAERVMDPVKPAPGETDRVNVADAPVWMIMAEALDDSLKSGPGVTVTVMLTVWKPDVEFPMMSMV